MKILFYNFVILSSIFVLSCKGQDEQLECYNKSLQNEELKPLFNEIRNNLTDTLNDWFYNKKFERIQVLKYYNWKVDEAVFIDKSKNNAILLLLEQDTLKYTTVPSHKRGEPEIKKPTSFDNIHLIFANKENGIWHYYYQSMESLAIPRDSAINGIPVPLTFEELSLTGKRNMLRSYYKHWTCDYNENFFKKWDITNLKKQYKFIKGYYNQE